MRPEPCGVGCRKDGVKISQKPFLLRFLPVSSLGNFGPTPQGSTLYNLILSLACPEGRDKKYIQRSCSSATSLCCSCCAAVCQLQCITIIIEAGGTLWTTSLHKRSWGKTKIISQNYPFCFLLRIFKIGRSNFWQNGGVGSLPLPVLKKHVLSPKQELQKMK